MDSAHFPWARQWVIHLCCSRSNLAWRWESRLRRIRMSPATRPWHGLRRGSGRCFRLASRACRYAHLAGETASGTRVVVAPFYHRMPARFVVRHERARCALLGSGVAFAWFTLTALVSFPQLHDATGCRGCDIECLVQTWLSRQECAYRRPAARA